MQGNNLYLLCTVHGVYCICKEKPNHVLQEDFLVPGCMNRKKKEKNGTDIPS